MEVPSPAYAIALSIRLLNMDCTRWRLPPTRVPGLIRMSSFIFFSCSFAAASPASSSSISLMSRVSISKDVPASSILANVVMSSVSLPSLSHCAWQRSRNPCIVSRSMSGLSRTVSIYPLMLLTGVLSSWAAFWVSCLLSLVLSSSLF